MRIIHPPRERLRNNVGIISDFPTIFGDRPFDNIVDGISWWHYSGS